MCIKAVKMKKKLLFLVVTIITTAVFAQAEIKQSNQLPGGFSNKDGKAVQLIFDFDKPIQSNKFFEIYVGDKKAMHVTNLTDKKLPN